MFCCGPVPSFLGNFLAESDVFFVILCETKTIYLIIFFQLKSKYPLNICLSAQFTTGMNKVSMNPF